MIKLKLSTFERSKDQDISNIEGENLADCVTRVLEGVPLDFPAKDIFQCHVNGYLIHPDLWPVTAIRSEDQVVIHPRLQGDGDNNGFLTQLFITVAVIVATYYTAGLGTGAAIAIRVGTAVVATYLASQLFPPPVLAGQGAYDGNNDSQVYSITSQANSTKKFGFVPKVYGTHRMFPLVAANPYTEIELDPLTGKKVQYFYAIYDFGFGPGIVSDLKIGDTSISDYTDVQYRVVDPNKPATSEGTWDDVSFTDFIYYKGDVNFETFSIDINANQEDGAAPANYQIIRNAAANPDLVSQEITVTLINPQGLYALNSAGSRSERSIDYDVYFAKVGTENWIPYNNSTYSSAYSAVGGDTSTRDVSLSLYPFTTFEEPYGQIYFPLSQTFKRVYTMGGGYPLVDVETFNMGMVFDSLFIKAGSGLIFGDIIKFNGVEVGSVLSIQTSTIPTYDLLRLKPSPGFNATPLFYVTRYTALNDYTDPSGVFHPFGSVWYDPILGSFDGRLYKYGNIAARLTVTGNTTDINYAYVKFTPIEPAEYKVRITRLRSRSSYNTVIVDKAQLAEIKTRLDSNPIATTKRHLFLEIRIKATGQLSGAIQNLSGLYSSVLDVWDGTAWVKQPSNNPAWVYCDLLTSEVNKRAIDKSKLHLPSIVEWANYCDAIPVSGTLYTYVEQRFQCNFILDYDTTLQELLIKITSAAQAGLNMVDGQYGVLLDVNRTVPTQVFTPRNSTGFSSSKEFNSRPEGLKVTYIDPNSNWQPNEIVVYDDGFDQFTATEFEEIQTFACTQVEQAWRFGRYFLAQNKLRQETITIRVDFEYLACIRGDYVLYVQDAMKVGGTPARVKSITGHRIVIDEGLVTGPLNYGFTFRDIQGNIYTNTLTVVSVDTFDLNGAHLPEVGDLIIIGEVGFITYDCIVKSITPQDDLSATLTLIEKAEAIYTIESVDTIPGYNALLNQTTDAEFAAPSEVEDLAITENSYDILSASYQYYMKIAWAAPTTGAAYDIFEVYVDYGKGFDLVTQTKATEYKYIVDPANLGLLHTFKVLAVAANGNKLGLGEVSGVSDTPLPKTAKPSSVIDFHCDITSETLQLFWTKVPDLDIREYILRYTPDVSGLWETSTILMRVSSNTNLFATQARTGTYLIKPIDFNGNEALDAAAIITTIPNLFGLNVIDETDDFPPIDGGLERIVNQGDAIVLDQAIPGAPGFEEYYPDGYYYYKDFLDMGDIYSVRIRSEIIAEGYNASDIIANWATLADVALMYTPGSADWDVESQYRATNKLNVIGDWNTLSSITSMSQGSDDIWTPWRKFIIGDVTARIVQFRLKLSSYVQNITPRVFSAKIMSDMPDRIESYNNLVAPIGGLEVLYDPPFKGPGTNPNVQISLENGQSGDYWTFIYKDLNGFKIVFYDKTNNPVSRMFDAAVKGYGRKALNTI